MSKLRLLVMSLCASLCAMGVCAQQPRRLSLEEIFALADNNSKTLKSESTALEEATAAVREARNGRLPDINLSLSASYLGNGHLSDRDFSNGQNIKMPHFGNGLAVEASQLVYGGGVVNEGIALSRLKEEMASVNLEASRSRVRFMLTGFYLDLYKLQNLLKVYDRNIALAEKVIDDTRAREAAGVALRNDITRYELQLKNLQLERRRVENSAEILNYDLVTMLGLAPDTQILPDTTLLERTLPKHDAAYWQAEALKDAYAIKQSVLAVEMGERSERLAIAERMPKVAVLAANYFDGPITIEVPVIDKNFNYWYVGVGVSFPISSLYKAGKSIKRARLQSTLNRRRLEEVQEQTSLSVEADYIKYQEAYDEVATLEKSLQLALENYAVVENRYCNDMALVTDMLDAASQRLGAELQLANARINIIFNYYKLLNTSGNL